MNKNFKIIQINGLSGLLLLALVGLSVICGFVFFPIWVLMIGWNAVVGEIFHKVTINYFQSMLLWFSILLALYLFLRNSITIKFEKPMDTNDFKEMIKETKNPEEEANKEEIQK